MHISILRRIVQIFSNVSVLPVMEPPFFEKYYSKGAKRDARPSTPQKIQNTGESISTQPAKQNPNPLTLVHQGHPLTQMVLNLNSTKKLINEIIEVG